MGKRATPPAKAAIKMVSGKKLCTLDNKGYPSIEELILSKSFNALRRCSQRKNNDNNFFIRKRTARKIICDSVRFDKKLSNLLFLLLENEGLIVRNNNYVLIVGGDPDA